MALLSSSIPNLVGGVSQQPPALRLPTTAERMENAYPSVVSGLLKRPPSLHVATISGLNTANGVAGYLIEREDTYKYIVNIAGGDLKVYSLIDGTSQTVTFPNGKSYLSSTSPVDDFRFVTVGDYTFITNRKVVPESSAIAEPVTGTRLDPSTRGTIYVTAAVANTYYTVYINNVLKAQYLTPKGVDAASSVPDTGEIATQLKNGLTTSGYTVTQFGSTLTISNLASTDTIRVQGNTGDKSLRAFKDRVQSFSDLPPFAPEGLLVMVAGDVKDQGDDYYVVYQKGVWVETVGYNAGRQLTNSTMPHVLIRNTDGTWTFKRHTWQQRLAGDSSSNSDPSFVGYPIKDVFVYGNRLGFLSDENVILSETANFENFYRTTVAQLIDSDRIDIAVLNNGVNTLQHAVPYNNDLLLMSDRAQFRLKYQNYLGPKNVEAKFTTAFNVSSRIRPLNTGESVYFVDDRSDYVYSKVYEYYPKDGVFYTDTADEVSAPVPEYMHSGVKFMAGSTRNKAIFFGIDSEPNKLYFYKYYWNGQQKVQTAWSHWTFTNAENIHWGVFSGSYLYLLIERKTSANNTSLFLERVRCDEDVFNTDSDYEVLLDRRLTNVVKTYDPVNDKTFIVTPFSMTGVPEIVSFNTSEGIKGLRHTVTKIANNEFSVPGDVSTHTVYVGVPYTFLFEFSPVYPRETKGQGQVVMLDGRLQVRYITVEYHDTSYFQTYLELPGRDQFTSAFSGRTVGDSEDTLGSQAFASGYYRIPVMSKNTEARLWITNDSPFPCAFGQAEWQGQWNPKSRKRI